MRKLQFYYKGLPKAWATLSKEDFVISEKKLAELSKKITNLPEKPITLFIGGSVNGAGLLVNETFDNIKYQGIDFIKYFDSTFDKSNDSIDIGLYDTDVIVIYNVGLEKAMNTSFSARLLIGLVEQIKNAGKHCFIASHYSYTNFYKAYELDVVNKLNIKEQLQESIF